MFYIKYMYLVIVNHVELNAQFVDYTGKNWNTNQ